jgi:hypothetical protein
MDEQLMFTRIHDALDIQPPAGAYERLRTELMKKPVRPRVWPVLNTRWTSMSFRLAAGLAILAIAAATAAAIIAIHNGSGNSSPAGSRMSIQAYQKMIADDAVDPNVAWSSPCDERIHSGCVADANRSIPPLQKWLGDLNRSNPPARFEILDAEMRQHLTQSITALHALLVDSQAKDDAAMTRDYIVALYGVEWTSVVIPGIEASNQVDASTYKALVDSETRTLDACGGACGFSTTSTSCVTSSGLRCLDYFDWVAQSFASYQADLVRKAAPDSLAAKDSRLQGDLAQADSVLLVMRLAVAANDQVGFNSGIQQLERILLELNRNADAIVHG